MIKIDFEDQNSKLLQNLEMVLMKLDLSSFLVL